MPQASSRKPSPADFVTPCVVIETRDRTHLEDVMKRLGEAGFVAWLPGRR
jgi:hypothetical protein